jgi:hypothetical protein
MRRDRNVPPIGFAAFSVLESRLNNPIFPIMSIVYVTRGFTGIGNSQWIYMILIRAQPYPTPEMPCLRILGLENLRHLIGLPFFCQSSVNCLDDDAGL